MYLLEEKCMFEKTIFMTIVMEGNSTWICSICIVSTLESEWGINFRATLLAISRNTGKIVFSGLGGIIESTWFPRTASPARFIPCGWKSRASVIYFYFFLCCQFLSDCRCEIAFSFIKKKYLVLKKISTCLFGEVGFWVFAKRLETRAFHWLVYVLVLR